MDRRVFLGAAGVAGVGGLAAAVKAAGVDRARQPASGTAVAGGAGAPKLKGRLKHSVCRWPFEGIEIDEFCRAVKELGYSSVELVGVGLWPTLAKHRLACAVAVGPTKVNRGFNRVENHDTIQKRMEEFLPRTAAAECGPCPMMIVYSGNNAGMTDEEGMKNCEAGLKRIVPMAETAGVTLVMELLNSKVDHPDYMARHTKWGVELVKRVGSARFKLLYNVYHMQVMEGDVIRTIQNNIEHIAHFHAAGAPGRHELDDKQELNHRAIMAAIADAGFRGYIGQEFLPEGNAMAALRQAIEVCDV